ncbi:hypothetical protein L5M18_17215 [Shewanella sp. SM20]|uniref:hypothetical protein n=1 Tax=Shewanella sp. SM20 TaxID=2912792 RepID=UPI0021DA392F|nr:hypothetical protein [Shewanella sp. SM20]MCU8093297.1 hypothetical protein [Shewanella sp. SM20]
MITIQKDESIYSLIFRTHIVNGVSNFTNIITIKGLWDCSPSILKSTLQFYQPVQDSLFYELLKKISFFSNERDMFTLSQMGASELRYFFTDEPQISSRRGDFPIRYCQFCISEQLKKLGFFYFKNSWLKEAECKRHNEVLVQINATNYSRCLKVLAKIHKIKSTPQRGSYCKKQRKSTQFKREHFAPCMAISMYQHLSYRVGLFPEKAYGYKVMSHDLLRQPHILQHVFDTIKEEQHYSYFEVMKISALYTFFVGWENKKSIKISIYKNKISNCSNCQYNSCIANKTIIYAAEYFPLLNKCEFNNELLLKYVTSSECFSDKQKRIAIQDLTSDTKLGLINQLKDITKLELRRRFTEPYYRC